MPLAQSTVQWMDMMLAMLPEGPDITVTSYLPKSLYMFRRLVGTLSLDDYEYHVCPCDRHLYPKISRKEWSHHYQDVCLKCASEMKQQKRFKTDTGGNLSPAKRFYYFGLESQIRRLFQCPEFVEKRGTSRTFDDPSTYWGSEEAKRCDAVLGGKLFTNPDSKDNSPYSLCIDWVQLFNWSNYSIGVIGLRCGL